MTLDRLSPETGPVRPVPPDEPPTAILVAELLMYIAGAMEVAGGAASLVTGAAAVLLPVAVVAAGLWLWMARANRAGHRWARTLSSILFVIGTIVTVPTVFGQLAFFYVGGIWILIGLGILRWVIGAVVVMLLWSRGSGRYYRFAGEMTGRYGVRPPDRVASSLPEIPAVVTDEEAGVLRACLRGDDATGQLSGELVAAAFAEAMARRFGRRATKREVAGYVADVLHRRTWAGETAGPREAEKLILAVLRNRATVTMDRDVRRTTCGIFLSAVVSDECLGDDEIDALLTAARKRADYSLYRARYLAA